MKFAAHRTVKLVFVLAGQRFSVPIMSEYGPLSPRIRNSTTMAELAGTRSTFRLHLHTGASPAHANLLALQSGPTVGEHAVRCA